MPNLLWTDSHGHLIFDRNRIWLCDRCPPCACIPRVLARWLLVPGGTWDLTPYQVKGFAGRARYRRRWKIRECSYGRDYQQGDISFDGTLLGLIDHFDAMYSYNGYMNLQQCCFDEETGKLIEPPCEVW